MRIAVIGYGRWGQRLTAKLDRDSIVAVLVRDPAKHTSDLPFVSSLEELAATRPSYVFVLSPIPLLEEHAMFAISSGANVFVEKPFTYSPQILARLSAMLSANTNQKIHVNHLYQYSELLTEIDARKATSIKMTWRKFSASPQSIEDNLLSHDISCLQTIFGSDNSFRILKKITGSHTLEIHGEISDVLVNIFIGLEGSSDFKQIKTIQVERQDEIEEYDMLSEKTDKLQRSIDDFFSNDICHRMANFGVHTWISDVMRQIKDFPECHPPV